MNLLFRLAAAAVVALALLAPALAAELVYPPGSRIGLVPPPGMTASTRVQGFEDQARGAVIATTELSGQSYPRVAQEFSREIMQAGGMEVLSREEFDLPGGPAVIVTARQQAGGAMMRKWALAGLVGDLTVIVVVSMPDAAQDAYPDAALRAALMSVMVRPKLSADEMLAVLPYRLADLGGFHLMRATPTGTAVLTFGPNDTPLPVEQPYFMVASRPGETPAAAAQDRFARRALAEFSARSPDRIVSSEPLRIGGASGHQIIAESRDDRTGDELVMVQWLRFGAGGYIQMFGIARRDQWAEMLPRMRAVRDGFGAK
jgi:hypothetical protein